MIVQKRRRYEPWKRDETVKLVRDYLSCIDELTTVKLILQKKVELFQGMQKDMRKFEAEDNRARKPPDNPKGESAQERVVWAIVMVKTQLDCFERLLIDAKQSMDAVRHLLPHMFPTHSSNHSPCHVIFIILLTNSTSSSSSAQSSKTNSPSSPTRRTKPSSFSPASPSYSSPFPSSPPITA